MNEARTRDWNDHYATGHLPWDTGKASEHLTRLVSQRSLSGKALDVGCGTGTNSLWLAGHGFTVLGLDVAPLAIEAARTKAEEAREPEVRFEVLDFLSEEVPGGPFELVFDRGVFHTFDAPETRARFAERFLVRPVRRAMERGDADDLPTRLAILSSAGDALPRYRLLAEAWSELPAPAAQRVRATLARHAATDEALSDPALDDFLRTLYAP